MFEDGEANVPWNVDLANTQQYEEFINSRSELFPLRFTAAQAKSRIAAMNKLTITTVAPGDVLYLSLRYFDGVDRMWYDSLNLPERERDYVVQVVVDRFANTNHRRVDLVCATFADTYTLTHYELYAYCTNEPLDAVRYILVTSAMRTELPQLFN